MRMRARLPTPTALTVLLGAALSLVAAHGHGDEHGSMTTITTATTSGPSSTVAPGSEVPELRSYFAYAPHASLVLGHVVLMIVAWVFVLPISVTPDSLASMMSGLTDGAGVTLSVSRSRFTFPAQLAFLTTNALGLLVGTIYNGKTPDLYPNNAHHKLGWAITWIVSAQVVLGLVASYAGRTKRGERGGLAEHAALFPVSVDAMAEHQRMHPMRHPLLDRFSQDSGQGTEQSSPSLHSPTRDAVDPLEAAHSLSDPGDGDDNVDLGEDGEKSAFLKDSFIDRVLLRKFLGRLSRRALWTIDVFYESINRTMLILGFVALASGVVTYGGIFRGSSVFNGLAHFVKGGIFFWYGLLTLGRWMGCFADIGWAWNVKPSRALVGARKASMPSAEFVESFLFFLYGSTNVFLEHLAAWGDAWTAQDLEHVSISIMLFGGGLCGMLVESSKIRALLNTPILLTPYKAPLRRRGQSDVDWEPPKSYNVSMNPLPGIVTLLLGMIMSSHHQASMTSTTVHKQWGTLLIGCALARGVTYLLFFHSPPTSLLPSRPPSELVASFCLISGGLIFMASNRDTVQAMERHVVGPMFVFTVTMGLTAALMAWCMLVMAVKGWALRREIARAQGGRR
ncbi:MAG: hypothetical protein M1832_002924 [Thelocarpon impressellum]|nr:MAG: hypothetical protein M1832_002924 [Thelocarpon impressellum]